MSGVPPAERKGTRRAVWALVVVLGLADGEGPQLGASANHNDAAALGRLSRCWWPLSSAGSAVIVCSSSPRSLNLDFIPTPRLHAAGPLLCTRVCTTRLPSQDRPSPPQTFQDYPVLGYICYAHPMSAAFRRHCCHHE